MPNGVLRVRVIERGGLLLALLSTVLFALSCATSLSSEPSSTVAGSGDPTRPDLAADYDVLVGEMALIDGDYEAARAALVRAAQKDPESAYLELRLSRIVAQLDDLPGALRHASRAAELAPDLEDPGSCSEGCIACPATSPPQSGRS